MAEHIVSVSVTKKKADGYFSDDYLENRSYCEHDRGFIEIDTDIIHILTPIPGGS